MFRRLMCVKTLVRDLDVRLVLNGLIFPPFFSLSLSLSLSRLHVGDSVSSVCACLSAVPAADLFLILDSIQRLTHRGNDDLLSRRDMQRIRT